MSVTSKASVTWSGTLFEGSGDVTFDSSHLGTFPINWKARSEGSGTLTTPEELIAAAHASCFSMALSKALADHGTPADKLEASAEVSFTPGVGITGSALSLRAVVPDLSDGDFQSLAAAAKANCPVSQALAGIDITLKAELA